MIARLSSLFSTNVKNKDKNICFYSIKQFKKLNVYLQASNDDHEFLLTAHVNSK